MKQKLIKFFQGNIFPILLVILTITLSVFNFEPGTWLSGWDTLHPEFNLFLNLKRAVSGAWQEHQGLGATASQAHPAEIPRIIILVLLSLILPTSTLRYFYFFLCLVFGPLGVYYFLERIVFRNKNKLDRNVLSFLGALFYLLNLGTLQHFYVPLEMFATYFASLGWLFLLATKFLETKKKKYFGLFSIATFFSASIAHTATLFYAYMLGFLVYVLSFSLFYFPKNKIIFLKRGFVLILAILIINSFWLLPNIYFILNHGHEVVNSKIHRLFSYEAILQSKEFSNIKETAILKSFLFNWGEHIGNGKFGDLLDEWKLHFNNPLVSGIGYFCFGLIILGLIVSLIKKEKQGIIFFPLFIISFFLIIILNPSFERLYFWLALKIPFFQEALRFPFTKFSILLMFCYAVYFSLGISYLFDLLKKVKKKNKIVITLFTAFIAFALIFYMLPAFQGNLISPSMKVKIPDEYFQMFDWFNKQEEGRIAKFPVHTFWGWVYHDWGFQGAGFIWFGIKQPILDREFDRWSPYNEQYYQEMSYAIYSQNLPFLEQLLDKYQIRWILLDESVISPGNEEKVLFFNETKKMLDSTEKVDLVQSFGNKLKVYGVDLNSISQGYQSVQLAKTENIGDEVKEEIINQIPGKLNPFDFYKATSYKKTSVSVNQFELSPELCSSQDKNQVFGLTSEKQVNGFRLLAKNSVSCVKIPVSLLLKGNLNRKSLIEVKFDYQPETNEKPHVCLFDNRLGRCTGQRFPNYFFELEKDIKNYQLQFSLDAVGSEQEKSLLYKNIALDFFEPLEDIESISLIDEAVYFDITALNQKPEICSSQDPLQYHREIIQENKERHIEYLSKKGSICDNFSYPQLPHSEGYALVIESRNLEGLPLRLCLTNHQTSRCDLYTELPKTKSFEKSVFLIPPMGEIGSGYDINTNNHSIGKNRSVNHLKSIQISPVDYDWIQPIKNEFDKENLVVLNQVFEKNWLALEFKKPFSVRVLKPHVLVNGWANGWVEENSNSKTISFMFLPQLLEFFGFLILFIFACSIIIFLIK